MSIQLIKSQYEFLVSDLFWTGTWVALYRCQSDRDLFVRSKRETKNCSLPFSLPE
jgi:hypothetical protein